MVGFASVDLITSIDLLQKQKAWLGCAEMSKLDRKAFPQLCTTSSLSPSDPQCKIEHTPRHGPQGLYVAFGLYGIGLLSFQAKAQCACRACSLQQPFSFCFLTFSLVQAQRFRGLVHRLPLRFRFSQKRPSRFYTPRKAYPRPFFLEFSHAKMRMRIWQRPFTPARFWQILRPFWQHARRRHGQAPLPGPRAARRQPAGHAFPVVFRRQVPQNDLPCS